MPLFHVKQQYLGHGRVNPSFTKMAGYSHIRRFCQRAAEGYEESKATVLCEPCYEAV